jgi:hypothetical protein
MNGVTSRFRALFNGFRARHLAETEPLFQVLDALHKPYQVCLQILFFGLRSSHCFILKIPDFMLLLPHYRLKCETSRLKTLALVLREVLTPSKVGCL